MTEAEININQCFKGIYNIGSTTWKNICTGELANVPWGLIDWFAALLITAVLLGIVVVIGHIIYLARKGEL